jgi:hypothetical protein
MGFPESTEEFVRNISLGNAAPESVARWVELIDSGKLSRGDAARLIADSLPPASMLIALANVRRELANQRRVTEGLLSSAP